MLNRVGIVGKGTSILPVTALNVRALFERELRERGLSFKIDSESGRHEVQLGSGSTLINLENIQRDFAKDGDASRVARFVEAVVASHQTADVALSADRLYWSLEPNDHETRAEFRFALSDCVDRVLVHLSADGRLVTWITPEMLRSMGMSAPEAGAKALANLARTLREANIEFQRIDEVKLGFISTSLPFKASLMLAPNLREVAENILGWPLTAVAPDRDFLYLWASKHTDFVQKVGQVVVREYFQASYPISTEVYEITEEKIRAIGEFPKPT